MYKVLFIRGMFFSEDLSIDHDVDRMTDKFLKSYNSFYYRFNCYADREMLFFPFSRLIVLLFIALKHG